MKNILKFTIFLLTIVVFFFVTYFFFQKEVDGFWYSYNSKSDLSTTTNKTNIDTKIYGFNSVDGYYSMLDQKERLEKMQTDIEDTQNEMSSQEEALKKAIYYRNIASSVLNGITPEKRQAVVQAYDGLYEVYLSLSKIENENKIDMSNLRALILTQVNTAYDGSCYIYPWLYESKWVNNASLKEASSKYTDKRLAVHVFLEESYNSLPDFAQSKSLNERMLNLSRTVDYFEDVLTKEDKEEYLSRLQKLLNLQKRSGTVNFISSYTQDVLSKYDKTIKESTVKKNYKKSIKAIEAATKSPRDGNIFGKYVAYSMYAQYLYRINGNKVNDEVREIYLQNISNVDNYIAQGLPEMNSVFKLYFANFTTEMGQWDQLRQRELEIAQQMPELKAFLERRGVSFK